MNDTQHRLGDPQGITPAGIYRWLSSMSTGPAPSLRSRLFGVLSSALPAGTRRRVEARRDLGRRGPLVIFA